MSRRRAYAPSQDGSHQYPMMPVSFVGCCDCGLVHKHIIRIMPDDFAVRDGRTKKWRYGRRVRITVSRDERKTAQNRRAKLKRGELYKTSDGWYVAAFPINRRKMSAGQNRKRKSRK